MATTSIWRVKGWLGKVVVYVENPDKTDNPEYFEKQNMTENDTQGLFDVIEYAVNDEKTKNKKHILDDEDTEIMERFVSGVNCLPENARNEMMKVKKHFGKEGGVVAYHGYQSFAEGECTPEQAHEIGVKLAEQLWGERNQVLVTTHLDKAHHLHNHFVVNTVSFVDGIRYHRTEKDYYDMQTKSDALCRQYNLSVLPNPKGKHSKHIAEIKAEQEGKPTLRSSVKNDVDAAIAQAMTEKQFYDNLKKMGYEIEVKKYIYAKPKGSKYAYRLERQFGTDYSIESIRNRILEQSRRDSSLKDYYKPKQYSYQRKKPITNLRVLYFILRYELGDYPKNSQKSKKHIRFIFREDLIKMDAISDEAKLLAVNKIDTAEQLSLYKSKAETEISTLTDHRRQLYKKSRTVEVKQDENKLSKVKSDISVVSKRLKALRREVNLCEDIAVRSGAVSDKLQTVREDENLQRKDMMKNEQFRRRSGTNR